MLRFLRSLALLATASAYSSSPLHRASSAAASVQKDECIDQLRLPTDRRAVLANIAALASALAISQPACSADVVQSQGTLEERSVQNSLAPPPYGMEVSDIFYPPAFQGSWKAISKTTDIIAPCGFELFTGGKAGYDSAVQTEVKEGNDLEYKARFVTLGGGENAGSTYVAADREYNAKEIAKAAMGAYSVVDTLVATPNRYSCVLAPPGGSTNLISVDILAIARKSESTISEKFICSEFVRQIVSPARRNNPNAPPVPPLSVKEIETISMYDVVGKDEIRCRQRTATFLVPSQTDPIAFKKWQLSQGKPVDVRYYDVIYTRAV